MSKERLIKKISLNANGLKGLTLTGTYETIKENKIIENGFVDSVKTPINLDLESRIEDLRIHVLSICGLNTDTTSKNKTKELLSGCDIVSFEFSKGKLGWIKIKATSRLFDTDFQIITTPKINSEKGYENFDPLMETLDSILEEVDQYTKGLKKLSDEELALSYIRHKGGEVDIDMFKEMDNDAKMEFCRKIVEKLGGFVISQEEVDPDISVEEEIVELTMTDNTATENVVFDEENEEEFEGPYVDTAE